MADLKNSIRINFKATYNQISPKAKKREEPTDPKDPEREPGGKKPDTIYKKALEKTAFIQSFRIRPQELVDLKIALIERGGQGKKEEMLAVFKAAELLIKDSSTSSTLNNARHFADIDHLLLVKFANVLLEHREKTGDSIDKQLAEIISGYQKSLVRPSKEEAKPEVKTAEAPKNSTVEFVTNAEGLSVRMLKFPVESVKVKADKKVKVRSQKFKAQFSIDESKFQFNPIILEATQVSPGSIKVTAKNSLTWAEKSNPKLFDSLYKSIKPYLSDSEVKEVDKINFMMRFMSEEHESYFKRSKDSKGVIAGFEERMNVEPVGFLHLERIEMYPSGIERGELVHSVPLAPAETVNISHKEWSVRQQEFEDIIQDYFEGYSEEGVSEKNDMAMSNESQSKHATALNVGASLSASYSSVTLSTSFGYNATSDDQESKKDSRNHSMAITKKASARTKKDHKVTFKVTSVVGSEDQSVRVITNPSSTDSMRIDYFQMARKWKADLLRYGLRMTYDIVIPNPGSALITKVRQLKDLEALINTPFSFDLPLSAIWYNSLATNPLLISNYDSLAAQYNATVTAPPEAAKWANVHKEIPEVKDYDHVHYDSLDFDIDQNYYIHEVLYEANYQNNDGDSSIFYMLGGESIYQGLLNLVGKSGRLSIDFVFQYVWNYAINVTFRLRPKVQVLLDWRLQVWNQIRQACEEKYYKSLQDYKDQRAQLINEISNYDALTLRRMEKEEIMKGVLRWILGPAFYLVPFNISSLFTTDSNDPEAVGVLDPSQLSLAEWQGVLERGEFIKYIHNAIEWENVLYFTYPYFWDNKKLWSFKKFLFHPDQTHKVFLRSGACRVVLTIRPGFEPSFTQLVENGAFSTLPGPHPYVTIAQEIQNFAKTNYPGFPPANPEQNARPLLYLEQRRVWKEMQFIIQLLNAFKSDPANGGFFPGTIGGNAVPTLALTPYLNGVITINGINYNGVNDYNSQSNATQLALDPNTPLEALLLTYVNVPQNDLWGNLYFYKSPGDTGDYDLISFGADGKKGGIDKDADISANAEASLIATWFEYTPVNALDIGITVAPPNVTPPLVKQDLA